MALSYEYIIWIETNNKIIETAIAGEFLGKKLIYLEAGSGAKKTINSSIISEVKNSISIPLIVGGGIDSVLKAKTILISNPDYIVVGNALEEDPSFLLKLNKLF